MSKTPTDGTGSGLATEDYRDVCLFFYHVSRSRHALTVELSRGASSGGSMSSWPSMARRTEDARPVREGPPNRWTWANAEVHDVFFLFFVVPWSRDDRGGVYFHRWTVASEMAVVVYYSVVVQ